MHFYYTYQNLSYSYSPYSNERKDFFCRLYFVVKELSVGWLQLLDREGFGKFSLV